MSRERRRRLLRTATVLVVVMALAIAWSAAVDDSDALVDGKSIAALVLAVVAVAAALLSEED